MKPFVVADASDADVLVAADKCAAMLNLDPGEPNCGFLYMTDVHASRFDEAARRLRQLTGIADWVGSVGIGICRNGREYFDEPGMVAMVAQFPDNGYRVFSGVDSAMSDLSAENIQWCEQMSPRFGVVHADPRNPKVSVLVDELSEFTGGGFFVGGLASSRGECPQLANETVQGGLSGVLFSDQIAVSTRLSQGCSPIGPRHTITQCQQNLVLELDGRPALEALAAAAGELLMRKPRELGGRIFVGLPISGSDTGDYLVRNLVGLDLEAGVVAIGEVVEPGQQLMFCRRDADTARADLRRMVRELRASLVGPPRGGMYYSCLARGPNLFGPHSAEMRIIQDELGDVPLAGFFANGEISHNRVYGYTGVLTLFT